jgi:hypothetical protein
MSLLESFQAEMDRLQPEPIYLPGEEPEPGPEPEPSEEMSLLLVGVSALHTVNKLQLYPEQILLEREAMLRKLLAKAEPGSPRAQQLTAQLQADPQQWLGAEIMRLETQAENIALELGIA